LGLLGWLALKFLGGAKDGAVEGDLSGGGVAVEEQMIGADATDAEIDAAPAARAVEGASMDMPAMPSFDLDGLRGIFGNVTDSLGSVTDAASAEAALPALEQADNGLGGILTAIPDGMMGSVKVSLVTSSAASLDALLALVGKPLINNLKLGSLIGVELFCAHLKPFV